MTITNNPNATQKVCNFRFIVIFVIVLLASSGVFSQTTATTIPVAVTTTEVTVSTEKVVASTSMDFALWFMGNKQASPTSGNVTGKKSFITAGMSSNKVMIKTFLKRVINQESNIA
jgi:hypothetical protein